MPMPPSYTKEFSRIDYKDISIDFLEDNGAIGFTFQYEGRNYGNKVIIKTRKRKELVEATVALFINAISTYEELCKK